MRRLHGEAVRDLLGIARAMFAAKKQEGAPKPVLDELAAIGKKLALALKLGKLEPDTMGHRAALQHAEDACNRLTKLISFETALAPTLEAACIRVRKQPQPNSKSEERKLGGGRH